MSEEWGDWEEVTSEHSFVSWKDAAEGDAVTGKVLDWDLHSGGTDFNGDVCGYLRLEVEDGEEKTVTLDKGVLRDKIGKANPNPGDLIRIVYTGLQDNKKGTHQYKTFQVFTKEAPFKEVNGEPRPQPAAKAADQSDAPF